MMKTIGAFEAKTHLSRLLREVETRREKIVITCHGRKVACLVPFEETSGDSEAYKQNVLEGLRGVREAQAPYQGDAKDLINHGRKR